MNCSYPHKMLVASFHIPIHSTLFKNLFNSQQYPREWSKSLPKIMLMTDDQKALLSSFPSFPPPLPSQHPPANAWTCCFHSNQVYGLQVSGPPQVAGNCWRKNALQGSKAANLFLKGKSHLPNGTGKLVHNFELNNLHLISKDDPTRSPNFIS